MTKVGFFLCTRDAWMQVLLQLEDGYINCALDSDFVKLVFEFKSLKGNSSFNTVYQENNADQYTLVFANCLNHVKVSMNVRSEMYNLDGKENQRDYLSAGKTILPRVYFLFALVYFILAGIWGYVLYIKRLTVFRIHFFMLAVVILKAVNLLCEAEDKSYIKRTGSAHGWDVLFYIFSFLKGVMLFTLIVLIGTGWSFLKPYLQDKEKKVLMIVIPLQVVANVAQIVIDETGPFGHDWMMWKQVFCSSMSSVVARCCSPSFGRLRTCERRLRPMGKLRVVVYALVTITSYKYLWTSEVAGELATLVFYVFTGYKFKPEPHNPYFVIDDEEEEAAAEQLKLEDEFEL
ncbi:beta-carotene isomerase D27 [Hibiscus syriacus]|uniref:Beta-carotene isomerase D27 n=1 Tax=Hibiscus syriacus TaxID=106335 RepID=A0A6A2ZUF0_HIBSY|nr:beta-carotene isomerase D27 [Hibiscus syriacus]